MPARTTPTAQSPLRESLIETARGAWRRRLIDPSRRNNLLYYRPIASSALELPLGPGLMQFIADGSAVTIDELLPADQLNIASIRTISRKGLENFEEKGLSTLYLALGRCSWTDDDGGRDPFAPVILFPVSMKLEGLDVRSTEIEILGDPEINPVLLHILNENLNVKVTSEELLQAFHPELTDGLPEAELAGDDSEASGAVDLQAMLDHLAECGKRIPGFETAAFAVIGNFSFQKLAMVKDLENRGAELLNSDIVAAIAGDQAARRALSARHIEIDPKGLDSVPPANEFAVMEADSSQQCAIAGIIAGQSAVVHGPPGTGKSQTITNLIATLAAQGKKVLFVAEKRAALDVVMNRLAAVHLDHLAIDLHGAEQTPKKVMERVAKTLNLVRESAVPPADAIHTDYVDRRGRLNQHDQRMHKIQEPTNLSVFHMQGLLLRSPEGITSSIRWRGADLNLITEERAKQVRELLGEAAGFESLFNRSDSSPWCGIELQDAKAAQGALDLFSLLAHEQLPQLLESLTRTMRLAGYPMPGNMTEATQILANLSNLNELLAIYQRELFDDPRALAVAMAPGCVGGLTGAWVRLTAATPKRAYKQAQTQRTAGKASWNQVADELKKAAVEVDFWRSKSSREGLPKTVEGVAECNALLASATASLDGAGNVVNRNWLETPFTELLAQAESMAGDSITPYKICRTGSIERDLNQLGVQRLVLEIRTSQRPAREWGALFDYVWLHSTLDMAALRDPGVQAFMGSTHNRYVREFRDLDIKRLDVAAVRARRSHAEHAIAAMNQFPEQESVIRSEAAKSRRHKPLRKMFAEAAEVLTAVCPCWMASPLSVSQLISGSDIFDFVIFDEASQILPEDAIPAILRGKHVVVAGDNKQLPPTTFFAASEDDDDSEEDAIGYESLLDMMIPFVRGFHLNWHYRSRSEELIAFSNHYVYDDRLVTFPGAGLEKSISHVFVDHIPTSDGQEQSSAKEVEKIVQLVLEHAHNSPGRSLGVITMGIKHANRIQAALDRELNGSSEFAEFFDTGRRERFFIKNLERVQGDERDVIILSVGYGKDRAGNLPLRFGPILSPGGTRRLNVAATRAKEQVIVVSSFLYSDINSSLVRPETGLEFLKNYLEYAGSGGRLLTSGKISAEPPNEFELDIQEALSSEGIVLVPQLGCSTFRIDLAACHPTEPGRYVLAIECDGATYHSGYTARDRDRLRQQQLERLGWTFHRIWSTDWFLRRDEEIKRAVEAFHKAVAKSDRRDQAAQDSSSAVPPPPRPPEGEAATNGSRTPRTCPVPWRKSIDYYSNADLRTLLRWVKSDGKLRTNDELAQEIFKALPFARRGSKIDAVIKQAIARG